MMARAPSTVERWNDRLCFEGNCQVVDVFSLYDEQRMFIVQLAYPATDVCRPEKYILIDSLGQRPEQLLLEVCNDGYGALKIGEDAYYFASSVFEHSRRGGDRYSWQVDSRLSLQNGRMQYRSLQTSMQSVSQNYNQVFSFDFTNFQGTYFERGPLCDTQGHRGEIMAVAIPVYNLGFREMQNWKNIDFSQCLVSASIGSQADSIQVAKMKVMFASATELYIEIENERFIHTNTDPFLNDHLRIYGMRDTGHSDLVQPEHETLSPEQSRELPDRSFVLDATAMGRAFRTASERCLPSYEDEYMISLSTGDTFSHTEMREETWRNSYQVSQRSSSRPGFIERHSLIVDGKSILRLRIRLPYSYRRINVQYHALHQNEIVATTRSQSDRQSEPFQAMLPGLVQRQDGLFSCRVEGERAFRRPVFPEAGAALIEPQSIQESFLR